MKHKLIKRLLEEGIEGIEITKLVKIYYNLKNFIESLQNILDTAKEKIQKYAENENVDVVVVPGFTASVSKIEKYTYNIDGLKKLFKKNKLSEDKFILKEVTVKETVDEDALLSEFKYEQISKYVTHKVHKRLRVSQRAKKVKELV